MTRGMRWMQRRQSILPVAGSTQHHRRSHAPVACLAQVEVLEPVLLLLRQMPRFRGASDSDVAGRAFSDLSEFTQYRRAPGSAYPGPAPHCCVVTPQV